MTPFEFTTAETEDCEPDFDFKTGEDAIFEVIWLGEDGSRSWSHGFWKDHQIEDSMVLGKRDDPIGALSYDQSYGAGLTYTLESMVDVPGPGVYIIEGVTCTFHKGDGWITDDDVEFEYFDVRPATIEETFDGSIFPKVNFWSSEPENCA